MIISVDTEKAFDKIYPTFIKTLREVGTDWSFLSLMKHIYKQSIGRDKLGGWD